MSTEVKTVNVADGSIQLDFTISDTTPDKGQTVFFDITGVPGDLQSATWNFGGTGCYPYTTSYVCTPDAYTDCKSTSYEYSTSGTKTVSLTVVFQGSNFGPVTHQLTVSSTRHL